MNFTLDLSSLTGETTQPTQPTNNQPNVQPPGNQPLPFGGDTNRGLVGSRHLIQLDNNPKNIGWQIQGNTGKYHTAVLSGVQATISVDPIGRQYGRAINPQQLDSQIETLMNKMLSTQVPLNINSLVNNGFNQSVNTTPEASSGAFHNNDTWGDTNRNIVAITIDKYTSTPGQVTVGSQNNGTNMLGEFVGKELYICFTDRPIFMVDNLGNLTNQVDIDVELYLDTIVSITANGEVAKQNNPQLPDFFVSSVMQFIPPAVYNHDNGQQNEYNINLSEVFTAADRAVNGVPNDKIAAGMDIRLNKNFKLVPAGSNNPLQWTVDLVSTTYGNSDQLIRNNQDQYNPRSEFDYYANHSMSSNPTQDLILEQNLLKNVFHQTILSEIDYTGNLNAGGVKEIVDTSLLSALLISAPAMGDVTNSGTDSAATFTNLSVNFDFMIDMTSMNYAQSTFPTTRKVSIKALKHIFPNLLDGPNYGGHLSIIQHEHINPLYDTGNWNGIDYIHVFGYILANIMGSTLFNCGLLTSVYDINLASLQIDPTGNSAIAPAQGIDINGAATAAATGMVQGINIPYALNMATMKFRNEILPVIASSGPSGSVGLELMGRIEFDAFNRNLITIRLGQNEVKFSSPGYATASNTTNRTSSENLLQGLGTMMSNVTTYMQQYRDTMSANSFNNFG